jgi:hypothetical protein
MAPDIILTGQTTVVAGYSVADRDYLMRDECHPHPRLKAGYLLAGELVLLIDGRLAQTLEGR